MIKELSGHRIFDGSALIASNAPVPPNILANGHANIEYIVHRQAGYCRGQRILGTMYVQKKIVLAFI